MPLRSVMRTIGTAVMLMAAPLLPVARNPSPRQTGDATRVRDRNVRVMLDLFRAIEERDPNHRNVERELSFYQPDVEFHWPAALPYGGTFRGLAGRRGTDWNTTWTPLQPTPAERRMDPQVIGADDRRVVILYHQRGVRPSGERFDGEVIGLYDLRDFKLARAQMFYFDEAACVRFLERAAGEVTK